jgi:L-threonylcarbamoyladenylate synthase
LERAGEALRRGELVAFPTETVYGQGANALDDEAVARIFAAKGRPSFNPLIVHVLDGAAAQELVTQWPDAAQKLTARFWPGPLSLVVPRRAIVPPRVCAGLDTVAVRAPAHPVARALLKAAGVPLAAPSANRFTELSPTRAAHVEAALGDRVSMILDGGACEVGIESTVLDLSGKAPVLLRPGTISKTELEAIIGSIADASTPSTDAPRASPGMVARHYAPRARLHLFTPGEPVEKRGRTGAILRDTPRAAEFDESIVLPRDAIGYARGLYDALHSLDAAGCDEVWIENVPDGEEWRGVRDRLARATHP